MIWNPIEKNKWIFDKVECDDFAIIKTIMDKAMKIKESDLLKWCIEHNLNYANISTSIKEYYKNIKNLDKIERLIEYEAVKDDVTKEAKLSKSKEEFITFCSIYYNVAYRVGEESFNSYRIFGTNTECRLSRGIGCLPKLTSVCDIMTLFNNRDFVNVNLYSEIKFKILKI